MGQVVKFCWSCFKWGAGIALVLAVTVGGYLYFKLEEELTRYAQQFLAEQYADLDVRVGSARYVHGSGVVVSGIEIAEPRPGGPARPMLEIPELRLVGDLDVETLTTRQPKIERVELIRPRLTAVRQTDGGWNFEQLKPPPSDAEPCTAPVHIHGASIELSDAGKPEAEPVTLRNVDLKITQGPAQPGGAAGVHQITIEGQAEDTLAKLVRVQGATDSDGGRLDLTIDVAQLGVTTQRLQAAPGVPAQMLVGLDVDAKVDSRTTLKRVAPTEPINWLCDFRISKGTLSHPLLPKQMTEVEMRGQCDQAGVRIEQATADSGAAELSAAINVLGWGPEARAAGWLKLLKLELNNDVYRVLPDSLKRGWERFAPAGEVDATAYFWTAPGKVWSDVKLDGHNLSFEDKKKFPYRLNAGTGSLRYINKPENKASRLILSLNAQGEGRAVQIAGEFQGLPLPPERRGECPPGILRVTSNSMRVTPRLLAALPPKAGSVLGSLHPEGDFGVVWTLRRDSLAQPEPELSTDLLIHNGALRFDKFPYPIRRLTGRVTQRGKQWTFTELQSRGDGGRSMLTAAGAFHGGENPPRLELAINGAGVPLDETLRASLTEEQQAAWASLQPAGRVNFQSNISYLSGAPQPDVTLTVQPQGQTVSLQPRFFPYRLEALEGEFEMNDSGVRFDDAHARHGPTRLMADGQFQRQTNGAWQLDLLQVNVERLAINSDFRAAAPLGLKKVIDCLEPQGGVGVHDGRLSFSHNGDPGQPVRAAWDMFVDCVQLDVNAGVRVEDIYGTVRVTGSSAGDNGRSFGDLQLDSLVWNGMQMTKVTGPLFCNPSHCRFGRGVAEINRGQPRPITAEAYGGVVTMDGHAVLGAPARYGMQVSLNAVDLARLNADYLRNPSGITGKLNGEVNVQGSGNSIYGMTGAGRLQATEADLWELPLLVSMLKVLRNRPVDSTAFNTVTADFTMQGDDIVFEHLDLEGDAISLYGRGEANLDRQLNLVFHTMVGRNGLAAPVLRTLAGQASEQLFKIRVTGKMDEAVVTNEPVPLVSNVFQQLQKDFRPQPLTRPAQLPDAAAQRR